MDARVVRAMELLKEAGRLDLLADPAAPRGRPIRRAASGVAATVAACSPPRERRQVSGAGRGRSGRLAPVSQGRVAAGVKGQPRPLGARRPRGATSGGARGGAGSLVGIRQREQRGQPRVGRAHVGSGLVGEKALEGSGAGEQSERRGAGTRRPAGLAAAAESEGEGQGGFGVGTGSGGGDQMAWGRDQVIDTVDEGFLGQTEGENGGGLDPGGEISHILEWSDDSSQGGAVDEVQDGGGEGLKFRVRPPVRTYGVFGGGEVAGVAGGKAGGPGFRRRSQGVAGGCRSDIDMEFFQGAQCRSDEEDPGELLAGSEPWEEEEVLAGPSAASWTGCRRDGKAVRAKEVITQSTSGQGSAPPGDG
ncbi:hypothetical protein NDU88_003767 [Pleurodeles waltl]|uniref:Uncharacterized protein n=1 Tax=Pleurodeles waltl TaxID=8319 RepID=A0AAV7QAA9_PLEWA|nr:hypothetical protein NDU88_003767 [Pleurodeles waltl]